LENQGRLSKTNSTTIEIADAGTGPREFHLQGNWPERILAASALPNVSRAPVAIVAV